MDSKLIKIVLISLLASFSFSTAEENVVNYWHVGTYDEVVLLEKVADRFYQKTGIKVNIQPIPWGNFQTKYLTAMASGSPPDAGSTNLSGPLDYGKVGGVINLGEYFPEEIARLKESIFPNMWPTCYFEGYLFGVPHDATALLGFYRKDIFEDLGLKPPETWSDLEHILNVLMSHNYQYGFLWTRNAPWGLGNFIWPYSEEAFSNEGRKVNWNAPGFLKGYLFATNLWNSYNMVTEKPVELFSIEDKSKALPLFFDFEMRYMEVLIRAPQLKNTLGFFPFPKPDDGTEATMMGGRTIVIFREGRNHEGAMKWIEFLLSKESQMLKFKEMSNLGERSNLDLSVNMEFWKEDLNLLPGHQEIFYEVYKKLKTVKSYPWLMESNRILEQSFYKVREILQSYLKNIASSYDMSVWDLKKAFASGEMPQEKGEYLKLLNRTSRGLLAELSIEAQKKLDREYENYYKYYGKNLSHIVKPTDRWDILDYSELIVVIFILMFFIYIFVNHEAKKSLISYIYITPPIVAALVFIVIPIIVSLYLSFTKYNPVTPLNQANWVGLENYKQILADRVLWQSLGRSLYFAVMVLPVQILIAVVLAACLDKNLFPDRVYKLVYFSPLVTSIVSVSLIWFALYAGTRYGWINALLLKLNLVKDPIQFLKDKGTFLNSVVIMSIWQGLAFAILILLAGLQNIPKTLYEAASIDGAGAFRQFFKISLPLLKPQFAFLVIMGTIGAIQVFEQIYMLGGGAGEAESKFGPDDSGMTIVPFLYRKGFEYFKMGEASTIAYILFIFLFILTFFNLKFIMRREST